MVVLGFFVFWLIRILFRRNRNIRVISNFRIVDFEVVFKNRREVFFIFVCLLVKGMC